MIQERAESNSPQLPLMPATSDCCSNTEDGNPSTCGCRSTTQAEGGKTSISSKPHQETNVPGKIRSGILFGVACLSSPCCTPLYVPLILALLAGTPAAIWLSAHVGWVYGGLTLISVISLVLAWRWWPKRTANSQNTPKSEQILSQTNYSQEQII
jgi:hypothetical protein